MTIKEFYDNLMSMKESGMYVPSYAQLDNAEKFYELFPDSNQWEVAFKGSYYRVAVNYEGMEFFTTMSQEDLDKYSSGKLPTLFIETEAVLSQPVELCFVANHHLHITVTYEGDSIFTVKTDNDTATLKA